MPVFEVNTLAGAVDAFLGTPEGPVRDSLFQAVVEYMAASYAQDGYTDEQIDRMDLVSASQQYIERRRQQR